MTSKRSIFLFTENFPFGNPETFLEHEEIVWGEEGIPLNIIPLNAIGDKREVNNSHKILNADDTQNIQGYKITKLPLLLLCACIIAFFTELKQRNISWRFTLSTLFREAYLGLQLVKKFPEIKNGICYSYWCNHWMLRLSLLRKAGLIKHLVCRVHGFDLYSERHPSGFIPFQKNMLQSADKVFAISEHGSDYLKAKFKLKNIIVCKLGVPDNGIGPFDGNNEIIQIVSCSALIEVKQVHLIIKALGDISRKVSWVHFGDGVLGEDLKKEAAKLPDNINVNWAGTKSNKEVLQFYKKNVVHLFVNVSKSEGIPVSIMEAMSFGIPVAAPAVGGIPEIVNNKNGYLLKSNNITSQLGTIINGFDSDKQRRKNARVTFIDKYSQLNYVTFIKQLIGK